MVIKAVCRLFIDGSINNIGWCVFIDSSLIHFGTYRTKAKEWDRLKEIAAVMSDLAEKYKVQETYIEFVPAYTRNGKNVSAVQRLSMAVAVMLSTLPAAEMYEWKSRQTKAQTSAIVNHLYKLQIGGTKTSEHCRDAIAMAHRWLSEHNVRNRIVGG